MLKRCLKLTLLLTLLGLLPAAAQAQERKFKATLVSYEEVPALSNTGAGTFNMLIDFSDTSFDYELTFSGVSGTGATQAHIHIGQKGVNGGIMVFFCSNLPAPLPGRRPAPRTEPSAEQSRQPTLSDPLGKESVLESSPRY